MSTSLNQEVLERLRAEYLEMPGLQLTVEQVQRLCGIERAMCRVVLDTLVEAKFLLHEIKWVRLHCIDEKTDFSCTFRERGADFCIVRA